MSQTYWKSGDWNAVCARCGFEFKASQLKQEWEGFYVCDPCWEPRHVLDFFKVREENLSVPWTQKEVDVLTANKTYAVPTAEQGLVDDLADNGYSLIFNVNYSGIASSYTLPEISSLPSYVSSISVSRIDTNSTDLIIGAFITNTIQGDDTIVAGDRAQFIIGNGGVWIRI